MSYKATRYGTCKQCGGSIKPGQDIEKNGWRHRSGWRHTDCETPQTTDGEDK